MKKLNLDTLKTTITEVKDAINPIERVKALKVSDIKEKPFDGMISSAFWMAGRIPVAGKIATKVLSKSDLEAKSKDFANKFFNPFYCSKKLLTSKR